MSEIAPPMSDNAALRTIVALLGDINARIAGGATSVQSAGSQVVDTVTGYTRAAALTAVKTVVTNTGAQNALVFEDGKLAGIVAPNGSWRSPTAGTQAINVKAASATTTVVVATYVNDHLPPV